MASAREINELHQLNDDAYVTNKEAANFLGYSRATLDWYRSQAPDKGPPFIRLNGKSIRYKMGDLREFAKGQAMSIGVKKNAEAMLAGKEKAKLLKGEE